MATKQQTTTNATLMVPLNASAGRPPNARMVQNFHLVWLDGSINDIYKENCRNSIAKLRQVVNNVNIFTDADECIDFITDNQEEKTFLMVSGRISQIIIRMVQDISQVSSVYIFSDNKIWYETWAKEWSKVKGVYTDIASICEELKQAAQDCDQNSVSISFIKRTGTSSSQNPDQLDQSFMNTQILKEIILTIDFEQVHMNEFLTYCQEQFVGNTNELRNIEKLRREYRDHQPIWWYTLQCFLYPMLNRALRLMEVDLIIKIGFFVRDLHNHIATLHSEQYNEQNPLDSFIVYRGQGLSQIDFDQLMKTKGGLLAFNNFLSTSKNYDVSLRFARRIMTTSDLVGVLFVMKIDPSISTTPFANIRNVSCYQTEEEILFSMHSIFRIGQVKQIDGNNRFWQVDLTLTSDNDPQLHVLTEQMREEMEGSTGWHRLGRLMIRLGQFNKAEELYEILLKQTSSESEKATIFNYLGRITEQQGKYPEAIIIFKKVLEIRQKTLPVNHPDFAQSYNNIGFVYANMSEYSKAFSYYEKALQIRQKTLPTNHPDLATSYNNIAGLYNEMGEYSKALSYFEKALESRQKTLPANHPDLTQSYNNIGFVCYKMGDSSKALSYYEKALAIQQKTLPANHPILANSYNNIGEVYSEMREYSKALAYHEKSLEISQKTLPANHPHLAASYNNIGTVYNHLDEYSKALSYHEKALEIQQKTLPANHPGLATSYNNIGWVYRDMGDYRKALSWFERSLDIFQRSLPPHHPHLQVVRESIKFVKMKL